MDFFNSEMEVSMKTIWPEILKMLETDARQAFSQIAEMWENIESLSQTVASRTELMISELRCISCNTKTCSGKVESIHASVRDQLSIRILDTKTHR